MFEIPAKDKAVLAKWIEEQNRKVAQEQRNNLANYGAISGGFTYCFTPTNIGTFIIVKNNITNDQFNIEDV
jgi:hypothetical protein